MPLSFQPSSSPLALGVDLGGTKTEAIVLDTAGHERWRRRLPTPAGDYRATLQTIAGLVEAARRDLGGAAFTIGIGHPGSLTPAGLLKNSNSTCLNGQPLKRDLEALLGAPVRMANDANCLALSEATDGAGAGAEVVFAVILGTGSGSGIAVRGHVLTGPNGLAGEWAHNPLPWRTTDDPEWTCYCGQRGCLETLVCGPGMARDHEARTGQTLTAREIAERASTGDAACDATLSRHAGRLARAFAQVINLLDPDVIVLGGGLSRIERLYAEVPSLWGQHVFSGGLKDEVRTRLAPSVHGDSSGVRGAAWLWRDDAPLAR